MSAKTALEVTSRWKGWIGWNLCLFLALSPAWGQSAPNWAEQYQDAARQLKSGDREGAQRLFVALWKAHPKDFELAYAIGTALDSIADHREATSWYLKALRLNPEFGPACNNLALNYASQGEFAKAVPLLERVTRIDSRNARAFYNLGLIHLQLKHFRQAAQAFRQAHALKPSERDPLARLAYASFLAGQPDEGSEALNALLQLSGDRHETVLQAVQILNSAGRYREAATQAQNARLAGLDSPRLSYEEANALFHVNNYKQAADLLSGESAPEGLEINYYLLLGSSQALAGELPAAVRTLQAAVRIAPRRPEPYYRLALVFLEGYRDQDAEQVLATGLQQIPDSPLLLYATGVVKEAKGQYEDALTHMQRSLNVQRDQPPVWTSVGDLYVKLGRYDEALQAYETATRQVPQPGIDIKRADLLIRLTRYSQAEELIRKALDQDPKLGAAYLSLGKLYLAEKKYAQAEIALRKATELSPNESAGHLFLGRALQSLGHADEARREIALAGQKQEAERESTRLLRGVLVPVTENPIPAGGSDRAPD